MRHTIKMMAATFMTLGAIAFTGGTALANTADDYKDDMKDFVPILTDWADEVAALADQAIAKPGVVCQDEVGTLARRGIGMVHDLEGTQPPAALANEHDALLNAMNGLANTTAAACGLGSEMANEIADEVAEAADALRTIRYFTNHDPVAPIAIPVPPVMGN